MSYWINCEGSLREAVLRKGKSLRLELMHIIIDQKLSLYIADLPDQLFLS